MTGTALWLTLLGMGLITYGIRLSMILLLGRVRISEDWQRALRLVPPAVLSAIIFPELLRPAGSLDISLGNARLLAGIIAAVVAWRTKNALLTIGVGMAALWILQAVL
jgi:branched-subunit amino acid transport protein